MQFLSASTAAMLRAAVNDDDVTIGTIRNKNIMWPLIHFTQKWNDMVDIMLGKSKYKVYTPSNGRDIQIELLKMLTWLTKWNLDHKERIEKGATYKSGGKDKKRYNMSSRSSSSTASLRPNRWKNFVRTTSLL